MLTARGITVLAPALATLAASALVLSACTGSDDPPESESTPDAGGTAAAESITIAMSGDVLVHNTVWASAQSDAAAEGKPGFDFAPMFASMRPVIGGADLAICHLETPVAPASGPFENYPVFSVPPQVLSGLKQTGYDLCTTASNHSVDKGFEGIARTIDAFRRNDLPWSGTAKNAAESRRTPLIDANGVQVAVLSYTFGTNGMPVEKPWSVNLIDTDEIVADAAKAKDDGADLVMVALHDGKEYDEAPTEHQREVVDEITQSPDIDLVYGHHAHTSQPFDVVNGTWVAYGLGNFIAQQELTLPETYRGTTAEFTFAESDDGWSVTAARFVPTQITMPGEYADTMRVLDARAALADAETPESLKPKLRETIAAVSEVSFALGARRDGLRMVSH
ncbi:CapA family protein [Solicola gregarius]|uniref:CapA family protein n=1 Tax=Solicola gregarius TaxID=2908642 RepID=A0AA46YL31_9ACTN|nr:CapA family protein [Solicola gregarius]UYM04468.1 CapA family protein [Solicola gregarius]